MQKKIRWGIIGAGSIARKFASDLSLVDDAQLTAIGSRSLEKANQFAAEFAIPNACGSYDELAQHPEVDVVYIATPHSEHHANTLLCLENGKAVLCEKAFAVNAWQAQEMVNMARAKKLFLMEALWTKFLPHYGKLHEILKSGTLGQIKSVLINFGFKPAATASSRLWDPNLAGGTLLDIGIYNVFMAMSVLGRPDVIKADMTPMESGADGQCAILFKYSNGAMAQLFSSFFTFLPTEAEINGENGCIKLTHRFYAPESSIEYYPGKPDTKQAIHFEKESTGFGYQYEARHVCECLRKGLTESPIIPLRDSLELMEVLDEVRAKMGLSYPADDITVR